jgi:transposase
MVALLFYGYATGVFSSRKLERATCESVPFIYIAGGLHPVTTALTLDSQVFSA